VKVNLNSTDKLLIGVLYRSPSSNNENNVNINNLLTKASSANYSHKLIVGDLNHPQIDWTEGSAQCGERHIDFKFLEATKDAYLYQHVTKPTHQRDEEERANTLDLIFTEERNMIERLKHEAPIGKSHHEVLHFRYLCYSEVKETKTRKFQFDKGNYEEIRDALAGVDWKKLLSDTNTEDSWARFMRVYKSVIDQHIPSKIVGGQTRPREPEWATQEVLKKVKEKKIAYQTYKDTGIGDDFQNYKEVRNEAKIAVDTAKRNLDKTIALRVRKNPKAFFKHANSKMKTRDGVAELTDREGKVAETDCERANMLNTFFASVQTREECTNLPRPPERDLTRTLAEVTVTEEMTVKQIDRLNQNKSPGPDTIHPRVIKEAKAELAEPLTIIFNKSIAESKLPEDWKMGQITPIFKKGSKADPGNYRPVSLTSIICKMLEGILRDFILEQMRDHIAPEQHGFMNGRSCTTQLLDSLDHWTQMLDKSEAVDVIYLDFAKAFDSVPHRRLLMKLESYGIRGNVLGWIEAFLIGRKQRVSIKGATSDWLEVISGVPQGSVLGPVLFICFINDMPEVVKNFIRIFADDTKIFSRVMSDEEHVGLQRDLDELLKWSEKWQLKFNAKKCSTLHLGFYNQHRNYTVKKEDEETVLATTKCEKDLGVHIDPSLSFSIHCVKASNKANQMVGLIKRSFGFIDCDMIVQLIKGLIRPQLEYGNAAWAPLYGKDATLIENVQRRATKLVPQLSEMTYEERLRKLKLPSLTYRRLRGDLIEAYKYLHGLYKVTQSVFVKNTSTYNTRGHNLRIPHERCHLEIRKNFISVRVAEVWNDLPEKVVNAPSVDAFKGRVDRHLRKYWYSTEFPIIKQHQRWEDRASSQRNTPVCSKNDTEEA
jgi:hypothetical protein